MIACARVSCKECTRIDLLVGDSDQYFSTGVWRRRLSDLNSYTNVCVWGVGCVWGGGGGCVCGCVYLFD